MHTCVAPRNTVTVTFGTVVPVKGTVLTWVVALLTGDVMTGATGEHTEGAPAHVLSAST